VAEVPYRMVIEKIGVDAPVVEMGVDSRGVPYVPLNAYDVAWYNFSSPPGAGSNAVFAGHVYWQGAAVFADLKELEPGDIVRLVAEDGREFVYSVVANFTVDPDNPDSLQVMAPTPRDTITLITCDGTWISDPNAQFGGYYTDRLIVQAELVSTSVVAASQGASGG
jgi:LPXTG-site transpeptidase (sortase) family protein